MDIDALDDDQCRSLYYKTLFPFSKIYQWLCHGKGQHYFAKREFSLTLDKNVYLRYQSWENEIDMADQIRKMCPLKLDIGAVYSARPLDRKKVSNVSFHAVERELVFDIDLSDYNDIRTCCQDKRICPKCWKFVCIAAKILDHVLRSDFGFRNILWVFSGRRGIHCWVCDERARRQTSSARKAIVSYLSLVKGGADRTKRISLGGDRLCPFLQAALQIVEPEFCKSLLLEQDILGSDSKTQKLIAMVPDKLQPRIKQVLAKPKNPQQRWDAVVGELEKCKDDKTFRRHKHVKEELLFEYCYPRLDENVTIQLAHLLKSPFCIHPDTGSICVPFEISRVDSLDVSNLPTVRSVLRAYQTNNLVLEPWTSILDRLILECHQVDENRHQSQKAFRDSKLEF